MALIKCKECGKEISTTAETCPHCGYRTAHGRSVTEAKFQLVQWIMSIALIVLGAIWVFGNFFNVMELYDNWHDSWYWQQWKFMTYLQEKEETASLYKLIFGFAFLIGGTIDMIILSRKVKKTKGNGFVGSNFEQSSNNIRTYYGTTEPNQVPRTTTAVRWECSQCHHTNPPAAQTCTRCGTVRTPEKITTVEDTITCPECGDVHTKGTIFCTGCGTKLV